MSWRGSVLQTDLPLALDYQPKVIPTIHPKKILQQWSWRQIAVHDLKRAAKESATPAIKPLNYSFLIRPNYIQTIFVLNKLQTRIEAAPTKLACDIETRAGHIACIGFAWNKEEAICIPLMDAKNPAGYWTLEEETELISRMKALLTHSNCQVLGQNFSYDAQYIWRHWFFIPNLFQDTMLSQHVCFSNMQKSLGFLSSMYVENHVYWKDEGKEWDGKTDEAQLWNYNCKDCVATYEIADSLQKTIGMMNLRKVHTFQQSLWWPVLETMNRGICVDQQRRAVFAMELFEELSKREQFFIDVLGYPLNPKSGPQMKELFYDQLRQKEIFNRKTGNVSCDDESLGKIAAREPILRPLINAISEYRSLGVFLSTFVRAPLDVDSRIRCSFNIAGTETYRFSSSKNAFGSGLNLQNIPKGGAEDSGLTLPNVRSLFVPDPGMEFFDIDLDSADLRIVAWEADLKEMKAMLAEGKKVYVEVMKEYYHDPSMTKHSKEYGTFKSFCHGCLTAGHEVLTPTGWIPIESYDETIPLMSWNKENWEAKFEVPQQFTRDLGVHFISVEGQSYSCEMTHDHTVPFTTDTKMRTCKASKIPASARLPMCGFYKGGSQEITIREARLLAAFQANGTMDKHGNVMFHFHKDRKMKRMASLLEGIEHTESDVRFYIPRRAAGFADYGKTAGAYLLTWNEEALDAFIDELQHWDGTSPGTIKCHVSSTNKDHCEWLQTIAKLRGYGSQLTLHRKADTETNRKDLYHLTLNNRRYCNVSSAIKSSVYETTPRAIYCPTTSTGFFFVRRNGKIFVTGNTHYLGTAKGLAERLGLSVSEVDKLQKWYFGKFPGLRKWHDRMKDSVIKKRMVENVFGYRCYFFDRIEGTIFNQAIAWLPQSTVACIINRGYLNIYNNLKEVQVLLQVHDSLAGQFPANQRDWCMKRIQEECAIELPYAEPLVIPVGIKSSTSSWGACG